MALKMYEHWAEEDSIPFFAQASRLLLLARLTTYFGQSYIDKHGSELMSMVESHQEELLSPWPKLLPKWASPSGRRLNASQAGLTNLIAAEIRERLKDVDACREADDYLSFLLVTNHEAGVQDSDHEYAVQFVSRVSHKDWRCRATLTAAMLQLVKDGVHACSKGKYRWHVFMDSVTPTQKPGALG